MDERVPACGTQNIVADWNSDCEEQAKLVSVLLEPQRIKVLRLLRGGELCVCEIERSLGIPQNLVSHHLRVLREAGLVITGKVIAAGRMLSPEEAKKAIVGASA